MSADNWAVCPTCMATERRAVEELKQKAALAYGVASEEEYKRLCRAASEAGLLLQKEPLDTFREDYEIGLRGNTFSVSYSGACGNCGLSHSFKHSEVLVDLDFIQKKRGSTR